MHTLKFTAVSALVVLALTGFSTGRGHGSSSGGGDGSSGGGGGGCSSSSQDHDSSSSTSGGGVSKGDDSDDDSYDDDSYGGSSGSSSNGGSSGGSSGSGKALKDGTAKLISCATVREPYATVEVTNPNTVETTFEVHLVFEDANDLTVSGSVEEVTVPAKEKVSMRIKVANAVESTEESTEKSTEKSAAEVDHCRLDPVAERTY
ncbi:hypothetical protein [Streptomyces sp. NPDC002845]